MGCCGPGHFGHAARTAPRRGSPSSRAAVARCPSSRGAAAAARGGRRWAAGEGSRARRTWLGLGLGLGSGLVSSWSGHACEARLGVSRRLRICNFSRGWCPALCLSLDPERHGSSSRAWSATEGQPREPQDAGVASCGPPKTAHSQHAGAPATLKTSLRLPHGAVAAERARYMASAGEAAVGLGLLEHPIVMALLPLHVLLRRCLGAVDSLRTWPGFWVGVRVGVGARARARLILGLGSARVRLAQSQLPHRAKPRHCASRAGASAPWRS